MIYALDLLNQFPSGDFSLQGKVENELEKQINRITIEPSEDYISATFDRRVDKPLSVRIFSAIGEVDGVFDADLTETSVDGFPINEIQRFEDGFISLVKSNHSDLLNQIINIRE